MDGLVIKTTVYYPPNWSFVVFCVPDEFTTLYHDFFLILVSYK